MLPSNWALAGLAVGTVGVASASILAHRYIQRRLQPTLLNQVEDLYAQVDELRRQQRLRNKRK